MAYTLGEAAKATGKSKTTIKRALEKGRISGKKADSGEWQIEPIEVHRVYPRVEHDTALHATPSSPPSHTELQIKIEAAERETTLLRELLDREREISRGLQEDRDHWRQQATGLLTDQRRPQPAVERRSWWSRLFGAGRA